MTVAELMLELIKSEITSKKPDEKIIGLISHETREEIYKISKKHTLVHIVGSALYKASALGKDEVSEKFANAMLMATVRYENQRYELQRICQLFENNGIEHILLKGSVIKDYYPEAWMRNSCDIDILVKEKDINKAINALKLNLGYINEQTGIHDISIYSPSGVHLELHHTLMEEDVYPKIPEILSTVWDDAKTAEGFTYRKEMSDEMFVFYHIVHMVRHFLEGGCGVRPFVDMWVLNRRSRFDFSAENSLINKAGLTVFAKKAFKLSQVWFSEVTPDDVTRDMQEFILYGGVYGTASNRVKVQKAKEENGIKFVLSRIFLPYVFLKHQYPILKKAKYLTPVFWFVRGFEILLSGRFSKAVAELEYNKTINQEQLDNTKQMLSELELL